MAIESQSREYEELLERVQRAVGSDWNLRTFKGIFFEIMRIIQDPTTGAKDLARVISMDPGLTARTLRVINSPYYSLTTKVSDLAQAIALLGFEMLKQIALSISVFEVFPAGSKVYLTRLWRNGLGVAKVAETVAKAKGKLAAEAYTVGLLHHIGKILLCSLKEAKYSETLNFARVHSLPDIEAEKQVLGVDHCEIGYVVAKHWELPPLVVDVIHTHHETYVGTNLTTPQFVSQVIALSEEICNHLGLGVVDAPPAKAPQILQSIPSAHYENLGFTKASFGELLNGTSNAVKEIDELLGALQV